MTLIDTLCRPAGFRPSLVRAAVLYVLGGGLLAPLAAQAARIVDTHVAVPTLAGANTIDGSDWVAESFSLIAAATLGSIAVQVIDADPGIDVGQSFTLALYASAAGLPALDFNAFDQGRLYSTSASYAGDGWNGVGGLQWQLAAGTYWLAVEAGSDAGTVSAMALPVGAQPAAGNVAFYSGARSYSLDTPADAFGLRLDTVTAVPEPSSAMLLLAGGGVLALQRRRSNARSASIR